MSKKERVLVTVLIVLGMIGVIYLTETKGALYGLFALALLLGPTIVMSILFRS